MTVLKEILEHAALKKGQEGSGPIDEASERVVRGIGRLDYGECETVFDEAFGTGWFTNIVADKAHNALMKGYAAPPADWRRVCEVVPIEDLKTQYVTAFSGAPYLPSKKDEFAPYEEAVYADRAENFTPAEYGRIFSITKKLKANDQIGAFMKWADREGKAWTHTLNRLVFYTNMSANPTMSDGNALFDATNHSNIGAAASALARATVAAGYAGILAQTGDNGERLHFTGPFCLIVQPTQAITAFDIGSPIQRVDTAGEPNPFGTGGMAPLAPPIVTPWANGQAANDWFMVALDAPLWQVGFLNGKETPTLVQEVPGTGFSFTHDMYRWRVSGDFGCTALGWTGMWMGDAA